MVIIIIQTANLAKKYFRWEGQCAVKTKMKKLKYFQCELVSFRTQNKSYNKTILVLFRFKS